jgi:hypothetical protein
VEEDQWALKVLFGTEGQQQAQKAFTCEKCGRVFDSEYELVRHASLNLVEESTSMT